MRDRLFVLRPGFVEQGTDYFCPYSAQVIGFLTYYPEVKATLDLVELGWDKPREPLASLLGASHQSAPILVLGNASPTTIDGVTIAEADGHRYIEKTIEILRYLAATRGTPDPH